MTYIDRNQMASVRAAGHSPADLHAALAAVLPDIARLARKTEEDRRVSPEAVAILRGTGLFRSVQPRVFGGDEFDFDTLVTANIALASACASTAWVCGLQAAHQWLVGSFAAEAQHDVWDANPDALVCGSYAPAATATPADGGWRVSGRWQFASGCDVSDWAVCAAFLPNEGKAAVPAFMLIPSTDWVIDDTWQVCGLVGTGSKTIVLDDVFVPGHRTLSFPETTSGNTPGRLLYADNPAFGVPMLCNIPSCLASVAVGAAKGASDAYLDQTSRRVTRGAVAGGNNRMAEFATIQLRVAEALASVDAASTILLRDVRDRAAAVREGRAVTVRDRIDSRRGQAFSVFLSLRAAEALNASTGGQGLTLANPVQRAWRDVNAVARHISMNWDTVGTMVGQQALGLDPKGQF